MRKPTAFAFALIAANALVTILSANSNANSLQPQPANQIARTAKLAVHFRQTGGLKPVCRGLLLEPIALPKQKDQLLTQLVKQSGIMEIYSLRHINPRLTDGYRYNIAILENGKLTHDATFDDRTMPESYRPLIHFLTEHAHPVNCLY